MSVIPISTLEFEQFRTYIEREYGISLGPDKKYLVESRLSRLVQDYECDSFGVFFKEILSRVNGKLRDRLIDAITTHETYWFRNSDTWKVLRDLVIPDLAKKIVRNPHRQLRIWSAGCSTGQEPYSLAMCIIDFCERHSANDMIPERFSILATDISPAALFIAKAGRYDLVSMQRGLTGEWEPFHKKYFKQIDAFSEIDPGIRRLVEFKRCNLLDSFRKMGRFDLVLLRNVIIYFNTEFTINLIERMARSMVDGGYLVLGATERVPPGCQAFSRSLRGNVTLHRTAS